jgi:hypothetical protein
MLHSDETNYVVALCPCESIETSLALDIAVGLLQQTLDCIHSRLQPAIASIICMNELASLGKRLICHAIRERLRSFEQAERSIRAVLKVLFSTEANLRAIEPQALFAGPQQQARIYAMRYIMIP